MRRYALPDGSVLVETALPSALYLDLDAHGRFTHDTGTIEPRVFELRSATGEHLATYGTPRTFALDDYFYILDLAFVVDDVLVRGNLEIGGAGQHYRVTLTIQERLLALAA